MSRGHLTDLINIAVLLSSPVKRKHIWNEKPSKLANNILFVVPQSCVDIFGPTAWGEMTDLHIVQIVNSAQGVSPSSLFWELVSLHVLCCLYSYAKTIAPSTVCIIIFNIRNAIHRVSLRQFSFIVAYTHSKRPESGKINNARSRSYAWVWISTAVHGISGLPW